MLRRGAVASAAALLLPLLLATLAGCGSSTPLVDVEGTVTLNGEKLPEGDVTFVPADSKYGGEGGKIKGGAFKLKARAGKNKVQIRAVRPSGKTAPSAAGPDAPPEPVMESAVPERYNDKTTLEADVSTGNRSFKFDLKSP